MERCGKRWDAGRPPLFDYQAFERDASLFDCSRPIFLSPSSYPGVLGCIRIIHLPVVDADGRGCVLG